MTTSLIRYSTGVFETLASLLGLNDNEMSAGSNPIRLRIVEDFTARTRELRYVQLLSAFLAPKAKLQLICHYYFLIYLAPDRGGGCTSGTRPDSSSIHYHRQRGSLLTEAQTAVIALVGGHSATESFAQLRNLIADSLFVYLGLGEFTRSPLLYSRSDKHHTCMNRAPA